MFPSINKTIEEVSSTVHFDWTDISVFIFMLAVSTLIGIYYGFFGKKEKTVDDYILGGSEMQAIPVAISLVASSISGITLIGVPAEIYTTTSTYFISIPAFMICCISAYYLFFPVFLDSKLNNSFEYLELRFDRSVRWLTSALYNLSSLLYLPSVIYIPSLSLSQVTGINLHIISVGVTLVCVFYTMIGGLKAVIWTDFFQTIITIVALVIILILGTINAGGLTRILEISYEDGKLDIFNMDPDPFQRNSFWIMVFGSLSIYTLSVGTNQTNIQRIMSLSSKNDIKRVIIMFSVGFSLLILLSIYAGILIYGTYYGCDPIEKGVVSRPDQIFPYYVLDKTGYVPTLPGLFIAGVFSAALSTLSTAMNTGAAIIYEDCFKRKEVSERQAQLIMKFIVVAIGTFSVLMVLVIENMGKILAVSYTITSITYAPVGVLFVLGMMVPICNSKGAIAGAFSCAAILTWIAIGANLAKINFSNKSVYPIDTCPLPNNTLMEYQKINVPEDSEEDEVFILYKLSFMLYHVFGTTVGVIVGVIVSYITGPVDTSTIDPVLICPPIRRFLPKKPEQQIVTKKLLNELIVINK